MIILGTILLVLAIGFAATAAIRSANREIELERQASQQHTSSIPKARSAPIASNNQNSPYNPEEENDAFMTSLALGMMTGSAFTGTALGGNLAGALIGAELVESNQQDNSSSDDTSSSDDACCDHIDSGCDESSDSSPSSGDDN